MRVVLGFVTIVQLARILRAPQEKALPLVISVNRAHISRISSLRSVSLARLVCTLMKPAVLAVYLVVPDNTLMSALPIALVAKKVDTMPMSVRKSATSVKRVLILMTSRKHSAKLVLLVPSGIV
jgi:hypothetical protein